MAQHIQTLNVIAGIKKALKRARDDKDDVTLKRRSYTSRLNNVDALGYQKKSIEHAGYTRNIIRANSRLVDDDGDLYSPDSSEDERCEPLDENPFDGIHLDQLLRPLTAAADLVDHPALSLPYKSKALTQMADEALEMLRRERANLWKAKRLLQRFQGDGDWVPSATFETEHDDLLLNGEGSVTDPSIVPSLLGQVPVQMDPTSGHLGEEMIPEAVTDSLTKPIPSDERHGRPENDAMEGVETMDMALVQSETQRHHEESAQTEHQGVALSNGDTDEHAVPNGSVSKPPQGEDGREQAPNPTVMDIAEREAASETASNSNGTSMHGMTTRARARSPAERSDRTPSPSPSDSASAFVVNPWFITPASSLADRDLGLPVNEAEETRKLLLLYIQKQEQVVRSFDSLYTGLQKADRLRQYVYRNCKAEGHLIPDGRGNMVTAMSDGEDWYDLSDWNIQPWDLKDGDLEKGKDEIEDAEEEGRRRPGRGRRVNRM